MSEGPIVGVDVGGTKVFAAEVAIDGSVVSLARRTTPGRTVEVEVLEDALVAAVAEVAAGRRLAAVGLAAAGFVDATGDRVMFAPHLPWRGEPVQERLAKRLGVPVFLDNDANCTARAESRYGAAREASSALVVTLGTGIGGAIMIDGAVFHGRHGMAGEFGHMQVVPGGHPCECGRRGCWEQYSSGNALVRFARARIGVEPTALLDMCGGEPERLDGPMVTAAASEGDPVSRQAFESVGDWLGVGLANLVAAFDPEVVVIGGGVSAAGTMLLDPARAALARSLVGASEREVPRVVQAHFGPEAGVVGAADLARKRLGRPQQWLRRGRRRPRGRRGRSSW